MTDLLTCNFSESLCSDSTGDPLRLRVALAQVDRVGTVRLREADLDELFDTQNRRGFKIVELRLDVSTYGLVECLDRLRREYFAMRRVSSLWIS